MAEEAWNRLGQVERRAAALEGELAAARASAAGVAAQDSQQGLGQHVEYLETRCRHLAGSNLQLSLEASEKENLKQQLQAVQHKLSQATSMAAHLTEAAELATQSTEQARTQVAVLERQLQQVQEDYRYESEQARHEVEKERDELSAEKTREQEMRKNAQTKVFA